MSTTTTAKTDIPKKLDARVLARVMEEGYGPGAWHGPDLKQALADVSPELAFWRPAPGRHNIAEIALHHAYNTRSVRGQLSDTPLEPFLLEGEDWFPLSAKKRPTWPEIQASLDDGQRKLAQVLADIAAGQARGGVDDAARFPLVLGITCHAVYHAGQVQLIKKLHGK